MKKNLYWIIIIFCFASGIIASMEVSQTSAKEELVKGLLSVFSKWYIGLPFLLCSLNIVGGILFFLKYTKAFLFVSIAFYIVGGLTVIMLPEFFHLK
ncbi:hypothetical protein COO03_04660 [Bacillus sp. AFS098217]|uniref:hypothetical protein n=1 Tax=Bacillus sp. AFS098217 TaxID=2033868 RepID=UPI000BED3F72|nr:hypothetical protein [Bacillus sp. AFS098217]PEB54539.1 hypothetical protein COO03_04660 [Bacillus sp. AFS098217]